MVTSGQGNRCFVETVEPQRRFVRLSNRTRYTIVTGGERTVVIVVARELR